MGRKTSSRWIARVLLCALAIATGSGLATKISVGRAEVATVVYQLADRLEGHRLVEPIEPPRHTPDPHATQDVPSGVNGRSRTTTRTEAVASKVPLVPTRDPLMPEDSVMEVNRPQPLGEADAFGYGFREGLTITGATPHRLLLFTFDDGPHHKLTPKLLDTLDEYGVKAIFFLTANKLRGDNRRERQYQAIARDIIARGHTVANHTLDHQQLPLHADHEVARQIDEAQRLFEKALGQRPYLLRPPGGARSPRVDAMIAERGYTSVLWNLGSGDFQVRSAEDVFQTWKRVFERREVEIGERGGIILMHDTYEWTVDAVPMVLDYVRRKNCEFLEKGEELFDIVDDLSLFYVPRDARDDVSAEAAAAALPMDLLAQRQAKVREQAEAHCK